MTPVGKRAARRTAQSTSALPVEQAAYHSANSTWRDSGADLFRDARALRIGDVVTVKVQINDKANRWTIR